MPRARTMFCVRIAAVLRDSRMKAGILQQVVVHQGDVGVSIAVSVPAAPMAKPMSARASAGESLPSPTMPTWPSPPTRLSMVLSLSSGSWSPRASEIPTWAAMAAAVCWLSPSASACAHPAPAGRPPPHGWFPSRCRPLQNAEHGRIVHQQDRCLALALQGLQPSLERRSLRPSSWASLWLPMCNMRPATRPRTPRPGSREVVDLVQRDAVTVRLAGDGLRHRMVRACREACGPGGNFLRLADQRHEVGLLGLAMCECAGLVQGQRLELAPSR